MAQLPKDMIAPILDDLKAGESAWIKRTAMMVGTNGWVYLYPYSPTSKEADHAYCIKATYYRMYKAGLIKMFLVDMSHAGREPFVPSPIHTDTYFWVSELIT